MIVHALIALLVCADSSQCFYRRPSACTAYETTSNKIGPLPLFDSLFDKFTVPADSYSLIGSK